VRAQRATRQVQSVGGPEKEYAFDVGQVDGGVGVGGAGAGVGVSCVSGKSFISSCYLLFAIPFGSPSLL
jgi:hypothetical protein